MPSAIKRRSRFFASRIAVLVAVVLSSTVLTATSANAWESVGRFQNWQTGACLDSNAQGEVYTLSCQSGNAFQTWYVRSTGSKSGDGYDQVRLVNKATGRCLRQYLSPGDNNSIHVNTVYCDNDKGGTVIDGRGPNWGNVQLRATHYSTYGRQLCVDSARSGTAYSNLCNYGTYQTWRLLLR